MHSFGAAGTRWHPPAIAPTSVCARPPDRAAAGSERALSPQCSAATRTHASLTLQWRPALLLLLRLLFSQLGGLRLLQACISERSRQAPRACCSKCGSRCAVCSCSCGHRHRALHAHAAARLLQAHLALSRQALRARLWRRHLAPVHRWARCANRSSGSSVMDKSARTRIGPECTQALHAHPPARAPPRPHAHPCSPVGW